ncbi:MAG: hypothetical protein JNJ73_19890 [Hyphomonadaceae bacterium]|nr:hypothetical protein [Hyphomonadaceae bacterium]
MLTAIDQSDASEGPFTRALIARYYASTKLALKWARVAKAPDTLPDLRTAVIYAAGTNANEIASRAASKVQLPILMPKDEPSRGQFAHLVFQQLIVFGFIIEAKMEGVELSGADVGPSVLLTSLPLHTDLARAELVSASGKIVKQIVQTETNYATDLYKLSRLFVEHIPAGDGRAFLQGANLDELFGHMLTQLIKTAPQ